MSTAATSTATTAASGSHRLSSNGPSTWNVPNVDSKSRTPGLVAPEEYAAGFASHFRPSLNIGAAASTSVLGHDVVGVVTAAERQLSPSLAPEPPIRFREEFRAPK